MRPTYYITAWLPNYGGQILGTMDGQAVIRCRNYKRSAAYRRIIALEASVLSLNGRAQTYKVETPDGRVVETIQKYQPL
jgi:hypothetical protein